MIDPSFMIGPGGLAAGAGVGLITGVINQYVTEHMRLKREEKLLLLNADTERLKALYGGEDKSDPFSRWTRRVIACSIVGTFCGTFWYLLITGKDLTIRYMVDKETSGIWQMLSPFGTYNKGTLEVSVLSMLTFILVTSASYVMGFYLLRPQGK